MLQQQSQSIMGSQVEDWIQDSIEKMFNEVMFLEKNKKSCKPCSIVHGLSPTTQYQFKLITST